MSRFLTFAQFQLDPMRFTRLVCFFLLVALAFSCGKKNDTCSLDEDILDQNLEVKITRLEDDFFGAKSTKDFLYLLDQHHEFAETYLEQSQYASPDSLAKDLLAIHQDSALRVLHDSVKVEFADISDIEKDLENAFKYIKHHFPDFKVPKVYTFVSGFNSDLVVRDRKSVV